MKLNGPLLSVLEHTRAGRTIPPLFAREAMHFKRREENCWPNADRHRNKFYAANYKPP